MQRQYNGASFHACAKKGSVACGKESTKIMNIYILALRVPGASLQAQGGDIAHVGTVHTWGQCTTGDIAHVGQCTRRDIANVGQCARGNKEGKCYDGNISK